MYTVALLLHVHVFFLYMYKQNTPTTHEPQTQHHIQKISSREMAYKVMVCEEYGMECDKVNTHVGQCLKIQSTRSSYGVVLAPTTLHVHVNGLYVREYNSSDMSHARTPDQRMILDLSAQLVPV